MTVRVSVFQPNVAPQHLTFESSPITIGRAVECEIVVRDRFLSRRHAELLFDDGEWLLRDCGSVNGTVLNGTRIGPKALPLQIGDRITFGDTEVLFNGSETQSQLIRSDASSHATNLAIPLQAAFESDSGRADDHSRVLASLAIEFIEDRSMNDLFDFILDRLMDLLKPSRAALALFGADRRAVADVRVRREDSSDSADLVISRTLLDQVVGERTLVSYVEASTNDRFAKAQSMIAQQIRAAVCAPLVVGDAVLGVLYVDFRGGRPHLSESEVRLIAQISRFAAVKLENTRLREEAIAKAKIDEELRAAWTIQSRLLPRELPSLDGYDFAGANKPCKTVSGDYYDVVVRHDGNVYFIVADVSGKGITAALVMSALATAFDIFSRSAPTPAELMSQLNRTLAPRTAPSKFATVVAGILEPATGRIAFTNAGHVPPLLISSSGTSTLASTDMVIGLFGSASYRTQEITLAPGDSLVLFTDGVTEAENAEEAQLGLPPIAELLAPLHGTRASQILATIEAKVQDFSAGASAGDDVTMLAVTRLPAAGSHI
jgi:serine phosphatase RsbU (regulator of sigma subunit)/pSer/pThr/pTyr-binding forkhead associated (FHA) protein